MPGNRAALLAASVFFMLALAGCGSNQPAPAVPTVVSTNTEVRVTGAGAASSAPFRINLDGAYIAYFRASKTEGSASDPTGCPVKADLTTGEPNIAYLKHLNDDAGASTDRPGMLETKLFRLYSGKYVVQVDTPCSWEVVLQRQLSK